MAAAELADIQAVLKYGFKRQTQAQFLALHVRDAAAARAWLAQAEVANAAPTETVAPTVLQVAFSAEGLRALELGDDLVRAFAPEFVSGMAGHADRSRRLGDWGDNDPAGWAWGTGDQVAHVLLLLYALPGRLDDFVRDLRTGLAAGFVEFAELPRTQLESTEPFGFADGISQPEIDWNGQRRRQPDDTVLRYGNQVGLGEFVLGYRNEYGLYADRPLLDPARDPRGLLPRAEDDPGRADLGRNGSYLVLRQLEQHVDRFRDWIDTATHGDATERELLAARMVGRTRTGEPLAGCPDRALNAFDYDADPDGLHCPLGAHVRRVNPRSADLPAGTSGFVSKALRTFGFDADALRHDQVASARFHRLLRRGRRYGAAGGPQGLHFIALGANIARQFEFVQGAWITSPRFAGLSGETDPLLGVRRRPGADAPDDAFTVPVEDGSAQRWRALPQFVTVRGGGYFFLPGLRALRYITRGGTR